jgi:hypothetical protein
MMGNLERCWYNIGAGENLSPLKLAKNKALNFALPRDFIS